MGGGSDGSRSQESFSRHLLPFFRSFWFFGRRRREGKHFAEILGRDQNGGSKENILGKKEFGELKKSGLITMVP